MWQEAKGGAMTEKDNELSATFWKTVNEQTESILNMTVDEFQTWIELQVFDLETEMFVRKLRGRM